MYLDKIVEKHRAIAQQDTRSTKDLVARAANVAQPRGFIDRIRTDSINALAVITEIKRRSPSRGALNQDLDPTQIAQQYEQGGASCLSVLTDSEFFGGSTEDLQQARSNVGLPVLRKDFTVSLNDVCDARIMGADCVLLIVAALDKVELEQFHSFAQELKLDVLVEVHDEAELELALEIGASIVGVNQRDLKTFEVDQQRAVRMAAKIPSSVLRIAESGVKTRKDAQQLRDAGYHAILVGESLVTADNIATTLSDLRV